MKSKRSSETMQSVNPMATGVEVNGQRERVIRPGVRYRHYKGKEYRVLAVARHSETLEELVVYQALYGDRGVWVRPLEMFLETVEQDGRRVERFAAIAEEQAAAGSDDTME